MCRKNLNKLTATQRTAFTNAVVQLKDDGIYDTYVDIHAGAGGHGHGGPAFMSWHREFVLRFERDLQAIDPSVNLPYWDWTDDNLNSAGTQSYIWRNDFMGGPGASGSGAVTDGPFSSWGLVRSSFNEFSSPGTGGSINTAMNNPSYSSFRPGIEGPHGGAHVWVGGFVGNAAIAPRDPVFWLIHCNVDRLWAEWIDRHQGSAGFVPYAPASGGPSGHNLNDTMWPWNGTTSPFGQSPWVVSPENVTAADLLDHQALGYQYDTLDPFCGAIIGPKSIKEIIPKEIKEFQPKERQPKELKEFQPKELKELQPKELVPKERSPKELLPKEFTPKEGGPKELKEGAPKEFSPKEGGPKEIFELPGRDPFIQGALRPDLDEAVLNFEPGNVRGSLIARRGLRG